MRGSSATERSSFPAIESGIHAEKMRSLAKERICTSCVHTFDRSSPTIGENGSNPAPGAIRYVRQRLRSAASRQRASPGS